MCSFIHSFVDKLSFYRPDLPKTTTETDCSLTDRDPLTYASWEWDYKSMPHLYEFYKLSVTTTKEKIYTDHIEMKWSEIFNL